MINLKEAKARVLEKKQKLLDASEEERMEMLASVIVAWELMGEEAAQWEKMENATEAFLDETYGNGIQD